MAYDFKKIEEEARKIWKKKKKEIEKAIHDEPKKPIFSFLEGPPTANAPPGLHHLEVRTFKDIICKYHYMKGESVPRKGGWDTHGLPVEVQVEKKLGLKCKKEVLEYGMEKFIKKCRDSVFSNIKDWEESTKEVGYWIDLKNPYITLDNNYIESVWWSLKELYNKKFLYEGYKVVPFCPRCGTPLSSHEVSQGYKEVKEESVYIAFKLKAKGEYILAWTTTPWTLPGNVALAVGPKIDYIKVELADGDKLIVGKAKLDLIRGEYKIIEKLKGKDLVGLEYEPLYDIKELQNENSHKVILADFVTTGEGTGVVHTAGMYGEVDYDVCKETNLPLVHTVGQDGKFLDITPKFLRGKFVKSAEKAIKEDLKERQLLFKIEKIEHTYPFCWRCDTPLLYYAINSWFIGVTKVKDKLVKLNKKINWSPEHIKDGRFGKWLDNVRDWALSRFKFWGTPLPIWRCECGEEKIIGSVQELKENSTKKFKEYDLHRPWIDKIKLKCKCGKEMSRIPDLIDVWYDSGSAPFAQLHYPFENKEYFERRFPYDFIAEAIDQTRGWFYTLHAISTMLFDKPAYKNVICAGHVVDDKGEKMSKSKGNIIKPQEIIPKSGVDAVRLQFCTTDVGNQKRFSYDLMRESVIPCLNVLYNINNYYLQMENKKLVLKIEDKWILSKLNSLIIKVTDGLKNFKLNKPYELLSDFIVNDFSRAYIKITRDREDNKEIIGKVLEKVCLLMAPFAPYISEFINQNFSEESVHFLSWPKADKKKIKKSLEEEFTRMIIVLEAGLRERDKSQIGLKWPLPKAKIKSVSPISKELYTIIKNQLNVKDLEIKVDSAKVKKGIGVEIELDKNMAPKLEAEGYAREVSRKIQAFRKKLGLNKNNLVEIKVIVDEEFKNILDKNLNWIKEKTNSKTLEIVTTDKETFKNKEDFKVKDKRGVVTIHC
ncbi:isoleucine--tRNA ligase [archaeon]|jgi:isoleucyl-tRNA synthetase|nr:isoleucine--tRNA ligase [archaeon]MBT4373360.1 isoleucine--tRNA ligase [archaeon]MBT4531808.1 isoleucine--tRNA ligase [archaeon]MBT7001475.1 isoleucine--tRNA ligase [archaeon]MBT7282633.1 isoleucine--tRNA ligase [archaeon]